MSFYDSRMAILTEMTSYHTYVNTIEVLFAKYTRICEENILAMCHVIGYYAFYEKEIAR